MQKTRFLLLGLLYLLCPYLSLKAAVYNIPDGDVAALIAAMEDANTNGDAINTINLAPNGIYVVNAAGFVGSEGFTNNGNEGAIAFPRILNGYKLIINGNGAVIRRPNTAPQFRFFLTQFQANFEINNLTLEGGKINRGGGALFISFKSSVAINNCRFINNETTQDYGGAIKIRSRCFVRITNSELFDNHSYNNGGAVYNTLSDLDIQNTTFVGNSTLRSGGGMYIDGARGDNGNIEINLCLFEDNRSGMNGIGGGGGGLYLYLYNRNTSTVSNCTFKNNKALGQNGYGGGLDYSSETLVSPDADYPYTGGNNETFMLLSNSLFQGNICTYLGGGAIFGTGEADMINCTFFGNTAERLNGTGATGGGIFINRLNLDINNCTIAYNTSGGHGGGIASNPQQTNTITLSNSIIAYNIARNNGSTNQIKKNCNRLFTGSNNIQFPEVLDWNTNDNYCTSGILVADPLLGPLQDNGGPTLTMALLPGSPAIDAGGSFALTPSTDQRGVAIEGGARDIGAFEFSTVGVVVNTPSNLTAVSISQTAMNLTWGDNSTNEQGFELQRSEGDIFNFEPITTLFPNTTTYQDANLQPSTTYYYRIRAIGGESVEWSNLTGATTTTDKACDNTPHKPIIMTNPTAIVGDGTPASCNQAALQAALNTGGRIVCNCGPDALSITLTQELNVTQNNTVFDGGGRVTLSGNNQVRIFNVREGIDFTLQQTRLINGRAPGAGGLFVESGGAILIGSGTTGNGGGLVKILHCDFENNSITNINTAERAGGAIYAYRLRNLVISESNFTGNTANDGGAIGGLGSQVTLINSTFTNNEAAGVEAFLSGVGGAIYLDGIDLWDLADNQDHHFSICGSTFTGNRGKHEGGALYMAISDSKRNQFRVDRSSFINNQLISPDNGNGGAIFHVEDDYANNSDDPTENFIISNSTFINNRSQRQGGAVWTITGGGARIENCTFEGNQVLRPGGSLGGALAISSAGYGGNFLLNNNTFANNRSAHFAGAVFGGANNTLNIRNTIFSNNTSDFEWEGHQLAGPATMVGEANIQFPANRWNGTADNPVPGRLEPITDPMLSPITLNGGFMQTMALQEGSPAIDAAVNGTATDQRGLLAVNARDIGAYEFGAVFSDAPVILSFDPIVGNLGSEVTITGFGFTGVTAVAFNFNFTTEFTVLDDQTIVATVPDFATTGKISVSNSFGTGFSEDDFVVVIPLPTILAFTPTSGTASAVITITGTGFTGTTELLFNGVFAANFTIIDDETIEAVVPTNATTGKISLTTGGGAAESADDFVVTPSIASFNPMFGREGTEVLIQGTNLTGTTSVKFDGVEASAFTVENSTTVRATVAITTPEGAAPIVIKAGDANDYASLDNFRLLPAPSITNINPDTGVNTDPVAITGTNFIEVQEVQFNGANADFAVIDAQSIIAYVPAAATTGVISVSTPGGTATSAVFTVIPTISSFLPISGGLGTEVTVFGTNLGNITSITVGGVNTTFNLINATSVRLTIGAGATGEIIIATPDGIATSEEVFTFFDAPTITGIAASPGPEASVNDVITITGTNFTEATELIINGLSVLDFAVNGDGTVITFNLPADVTSGQITVVGQGGTVTSAATLTVRPSIFSFTPTSGTTGTQVSIEGANFTGASAVSFNGTAATGFNVVNATRITAIVAAGTSTGQISVTVGGQTATSADNFEFINAPTITNVNPTTALVGGEITITGSGFMAGRTTIAFNGTNAINFTVVDANTITVTVPLGASSGLLIVTTAGGSASENFMVTPPLPTILSFTPAEGVIETVVSISGTNLATTTEVRFFNDVLAQNITITDNLISAVVPLGAVTGPITLITTSGNVNTTTNFTVIPPPPPVITSFTPMSAAVGSEVTIFGDNLTTATSVTFNGIEATFTVINDGRIIATVPNTTTGLIAVITPGGGATSTDNFIVPFVWTGNQSTAWQEPLNWSPNVVPNGLAIDALIPNVANDPVIDNTTALLRNITLQNGARLTINPTGVLDLAGTITNQGTVTANGTISFSGNTLQIIPASITQFNNLTVNNPQNIRLAANIEVSGQINFIQGNLQLNGKIIDLGTTGMLVNESETSHITGNTGSVVAVRTGANNFLNGGMNVANLGANITIPTKPGLAGITIRRGHTRRGDLNLGIERYYVISPAGATTDLNATLVFNYLDTELAELLEDNLILYRYSGTNWDERTGIFRNAATNQITLESISQFSEWTAGDVSMPLPLTLLSFEAERRNAQNVKLTWRTLIEHSISHYEIQKSSEGQVFQTIGQADPQANEGAPHEYIFMDWDAEEAAYYRLKFIENSGTDSSSPVVYIGVENELLRMDIFPNPTTEHVQIRLPKEKIMQLRLISESGKVIFSASGKLVDLEAKMNQLLASVPHGLYILQAKDALHRYETKLIKQ